MRLTSATYWVVSIVLIVHVTVSAAACSATGPSAVGDAAESLATTANTHGPTRPTGTSSGVFPGTTLLAAFSQMANAWPSLPIFSPTYLPEGTKLAESWWPLTELADPQEYEGPVVTNPRVLDDGSVPQVEVLFWAPHGWFAVLENFRGDVGETPGQKVGEVGGQTATLYNVNGGMLVQWQYDGLWYGVFARGIPQEELVRVAKGMRLVTMVGG